MITAEDRAIRAVENALVARFLAETDEQYVRAEQRVDEAAQAASSEQYIMGEQRAIARVEAIQEEER